MESKLKIKAASGQRVILAGAILNLLLGIIKSTAGLLGHSNVLLADGIDSMVDVFSSLMTWGALKYAVKPPDEDHPYGHGKVESLAAAAGSLLLLSVGIIIAAFSIQQLIAVAHGHLPHRPRAYTLVILIGVIVIKEILFQLIARRARFIKSTAMLADAWHHRSDAIISFTAFLGITLSLFAGSGYEAADDWAALIACGIIFYNALAILKTSLSEIMDERVSDTLENTIIKLACEVNGVRSAEKCRVRKSGLALIADLHIRVDKNLTVKEGHAISHHVKNYLLDANLALEDITLHLEPD
ncbi:MAG: cation diffusion facilitator family transporter [Chthoniobacterales bacterium]|nr:cation diffusion facilitator family transporter [Chthoniobacterales bacterium]